MTPLSLGITQQVGCRLLRWRPEASTPLSSSSGSSSQLEWGTVESSASIISQYEISILQLRSIGDLHITLCRQERTVEVEFGSF